MMPDQIADLLRRALRNHDAIAAALRTGSSSQRLFRAIDDMKEVKEAAAELGFYAPTQPTPLAKHDGPLTPKGTP